MRELHDPRAEVFLDALEAALGGPGRRSREVLAEVQSDLEAAVSQLLPSGAVLSARTTTEYNRARASNAGSR